MSDWQTLSSEVVHETPWIKLRKDEVLNQAGKPLTYTYMELQRPSVFIVAANAAGEVLLQKTYRHPIHQEAWEIPAGYMEEGEEPLDAAKRELQEESGLQSDEWIPLGRIQQITGTGNVPLEAFLARNASQASDVLDKDEDIRERKFVSLAALEQMIKDNELIDAPVMAVLYMAKLKGIVKEEV